MQSQRSEMKLVIAQILHPKPVARDEQMLNSSDEEIFSKRSALNRIVTGFNQFRRCLWLHHWWDPLRNTPFKYAMWVRMLIYEFIYLSAFKGPTDLSSIDQQVEHRQLTPKVPGSNPGVSTSSLSWNIKTLVIYLPIKIIVKNNK